MVPECGHDGPSQQVRRKGETEGRLAQEGLTKVPVCRLEAVGFPADTCAFGHRSVHATWPAPEDGSSIPRGW